MEGGLRGGGRERSKRKVPERTTWPAAVEDRRLARQPLIQLYFLLFSYRVKVAAEPELAQPRREQSFGDEAGLDAAMQIG